MFDFIIEIPPEFCYGVIERATTNSILLTKESYAPGIWAGSEKMKLEVRTKEGRVKNEILILGVNLDTRVISIMGNEHNYIEPEDELYRKE